MEGALESHGIKPESSLTPQEQKLLFPNQPESQTYEADTVGILRVLSKRKEVVLGEGKIVEDGRLGEPGKEFAEALLQHLIGYSEDYSSLQSRLVELRQYQKELKPKSPERVELNKVLASVEMRLRNIEVKNITSELSALETGGPVADKINNVMRGLAEKQGVPEAFVRQQLASSLATKRREVWKDLAVDLEYLDYNWDDFNEAMALHEMNILAEVGDLGNLDAVTELTEQIYWAEEKPVFESTFLEKEAKSVFEEVLVRKGVEEISVLLDEHGRLVDKGKETSSRLFDVLVSRFKTKENIEIALNGLRKWQKTLPSGSKQRLALHRILSSVQIRLPRWSEEKLSLLQRLSVKVDKARQSFSGRSVTKETSKKQAFMQEVLAILEKEKKLERVPVTELEQAVAEESPNSSLIRKKLKKALTMGLSAGAGAGAVAGILLGLSGVDSDVAHAAPVMQDDATLQRLSYVPGVVHTEIDITTEEVWQEPELRLLTPEQKACLKPEQDGTDSKGNPIKVWKYAEDAETNASCGQRFRGAGFAYGEGKDVYESITYLPVGAQGEIAKYINPHLLDYYVWQERGNTCRITTLAAILSNISGTNVHPWVLADMLSEGFLARSEVDDFNLFTGGVPGRKDKEPEVFLARKFGVAVDTISYSRILGRRVRISDNERAEEYDRLLNGEADRGYTALLDRWSGLETKEDVKEAGQELVGLLNEVFEKGGIPTVGMYVTYRSSFGVDYVIAGTREEREEIIQKATRSSLVDSVFGKHVMAVLGAYTDMETGQSYIVVSEPNGGVTNWRLTGNAGWESDGYAVRIPLTEYNFRLLAGIGMSSYRPVTEEDMDRFKHVEVDINMETKIEPGSLVFEPTPLSSQEPFDSTQTVRSDVQPVEAFHPRRKHKRDRLAWNPKFSRRGTAPGIGF